MRQRVVIVGGGVAGLSAAHELVERDFDVTVVERRQFFGGKAASVRSQDPGTPGADPSLNREVPSEHGFRFYPGWYRHLPDTMKRIPYRGKRRYYEGATVFDNLVTADAELVTWYDREPVELLAHPPRSLADATTLLALSKRVALLGLRPGEVTHFVGKVAEFLSTPESKRMERFDNITWWDFVDAENKSQAFRDLMAATTRTMVAAKAREASAYTIGSMAVRTFFDALGSIDRVTNGPTNEVWIDPWVEHLRERGVHFKLGEELDSISFDPTKKTIRALGFVPVLKQSLVRLRWTLSLVEWWARAISDPRPIAASDPSLSWLSKWIDGIAGIAADLKSEAQVVERIVEDVLAAPPETLPTGFSAAPLQTIAKVLKDAAAELDLAVGKGRQLEPGAKTNVASLALADAHRTKAKVALEQLGTQDRPGLERVIDHAMPKNHWLPAQPRHDPADSGQEQPVALTIFIFALPIEQMAYYVNRSATLTHYAPDLRRLLRLAEYTEWMTGIQFYLKEPVDLVAGHLVCMDAEWSLTAVEQTQFWRDVELPADVQAVISVDIASWDKKGRFNQKEAFNCTRDEIALEVWAQLRESLNRDAKAFRLRDDMLRFGKMINGSQKSYRLDDNLVDVLDRRKQGTYEKARGVSFSADELLRRQREQGGESETPFVWGRRLEFNTEPLLVNRVGCHALRPGVRTGISNMFLASDYVLTNTDLACMEGANEAARRAVNAVLESVGSTKPRCRIWTFSPGAELVENLLGAARFGQRVSSAAGMANRAVEAVTGGFGRFANDLVNRRRLNDG